MTFLTGTMFLKNVPYRVRDRNGYPAASGGKNVGVRSMSGEPGRTKRVEPAAGGRKERGKDTPKTKKSRAK